jgi:hypothetical protein
MSKKHLCIQLSSNFCCLSILEDKKVETIASIIFEQKKDFQYKEALAKLFSEKNLDQTEFDEITLSWISPKSVTIPSSLFIPSELESIFETCFVREEIGTDLDYTRMMEASMVSVYEMPSWIKSFFIIRYPRIIILHEYSHSLKSLLNNSFNPKIQVSVYPESTQIYYINRGEVLFLNSFEVSSTKDVLYYLSFIIQQHKLEEEKLKINLCISEMSEIDHNELNTAFPKMNLFKNKEIKFDPNFNKLNHLFCV